MNFRQDAERSEPAKLSVRFVCNLGGISGLRTRCLGRWLATWALLLVCQVGAPAAEDAALEYKVKAGFLFNFAKFVEWPEQTFPTTNSPLIIGVAADEPAATLIQQALDGKLANGRTLRVKLLPDLAGIETCQMVFFGRTQKDRVEEALARTLGASVLTVGEVEGFAHRGGIINFIRKDETFRFEVNLEAAGKADLKISGKLANMATIVKTRK